MGSSGSKVAPGGRVLAFMSAPITVIGGPTALITHTIPANFLKAGDKLRFTMEGYGNYIANNPVLQIGIDSDTHFRDVGFSNAINIEAVTWGGAEFNVISDGAGGEVSMRPHLFIGGPPPSPSYGETSSIVVYDTTILHTLSLEFSIAGAGNFVQAESCVLEYVPFG